MAELAYREPRLSRRYSSHRAPVRVPASNETTRSTGLLLFFLICSILLIIAIIIGFAPHAIGRVFDVSCAALGAVLLAVMLWWRRRRGRLDWTEPPVWTSAWIYFNVVVPIWLLDREGVPRIAWLDSSVQMPKAVAMIGAGLLGMWLGHIASTWRPVTWRPKGPPLVAMTFLIWIVSTVPLVVATLSDAGSSQSSSPTGIGIWLNYVAFTTTLAILARSVLLIHYLQVRPKVGWVLVCISASYELVLSVVAAKKGFALSMIMLAMCIYYGTKRVRVSYWLAASLLVLFFVPVVTTFRATKASGGNDTLAGRISDLNYAIGENARLSFGQLVQNVTGTVVGRQGGLLATDASVITIHPDVLPYEGRELAAEFASALIPRFLWPSKPTGTSGLYLNTTRYWGAATEYTFTSIGQFGDAYRAGGWVAMILWSALSGLYLGHLYHRGAAERDPIAGAWYITILFVVFYYENDLTTSLLRIVQFCPLLWFASRYLMTNTRQRLR